MRPILVSTTMLDQLEKIVRGVDRASQTLRLRKLAVAYWFQEMGSPEIDNL